MNVEQMDYLPVVSVIIPVYNIANYIGRSVESIFNQTYKNIQVIIVDDGSTDETYNVCIKLAKNDERITYVRHEINKGQTVAINDGLKVATGEWVLFLDGDDVLEPYAISILLDTINDNDIDIVFAGFKLIDSDNSTEYLANIKKGTYTRREFINFLFDDMSFSVLTCIGSKIYRMSFVKNRKEYTSDRIKANYDMAFVIDALISCRKVAYINKSIYGYIQRKDSTTYSYMNKMYRRICDAREKIPLLIRDCDFYEKKNLLFQRKQLSLIVSALNQEVIFKKGYGQFRHSVDEISDSDEFCQLYRTFHESKVDNKRLLYIEIVKRKKYVLLIALHRILLMIKKMRK